MGVPVDVWRIRIGTFHLSSKSQPRRPVNHESYKPDCQWTPGMDMSYRIFSATLIVFCVCMVSCTITQISQDVFCDSYPRISRINYAEMIMDTQKVNNDFYHFSQCLLLLLCGDVETNPGPATGASNESEATKFQRELLAEMKSLTKEMKSIKTETSKMNTTLTSIKADIFDLRSQQDIIRSDVDDVNERLERLEDVDSSDRATHDYVSRLHEKIHGLEEQIDRQEQYSRRSNVILYGLPQQALETASACKDYVCDILSKCSCDSISPDRLVAAHRLPNRSGKSPKPMIVKFIYPEDKVWALGLRDQLKKSGFGISNDLTKCQREKLKELKDDNKHGYYKNGKLVVTERRLPQGNVIHNRQLPRNTSVICAQKTKRNRGVARASVILY